MPTPKVTTEFIRISPDVAKQMLTHNLTNRSTKTGKIQQYARDMAAGNWLTTGEALKFDTRGFLIDGQNRLNAVILSGAIVTMLVIRGLPPEAQDVMDSGAARTTGDVLRIKGYPNPNILAAAAGTYRNWHEGAYTHAMSTEGQKPSHSEAVAVIDAHPELVEAAAFASTLRKVMNLPQGAIATAFVEFTAIDADDCVEFFSRCKELRTEGVGDPVNTLLKRAADLRVNRQRVFPSTALFMLFRTWNACRSGEHLSKLQLGSPLRGWATIPEPK